MAQTDGEPLPEAAEASGDPGTQTAALRAAILERGIAIEAADDLGGALGTAIEADASRARRAGTRSPHQPIGSSRH